MVVKVFLCNTLTLQVLNEIKWNHLSTLTSLRGVSNRNTHNLILDMQEGLGRGKKHDTPDLRKSVTRI